MAKMAVSIRKMSIKASVNPQIFSDRQAIFNFATLLKVLLQTPSISFTLHEKSNLPVNCTLTFISAFLISKEKGEIEVKLTVDISWLICVNRGLSVAPVRIKSRI